MMKTLKSAVQTLCLLLFTTHALAHSGHDHSHWTSDLLHILFYASIAGVIAAISYMLIKRKSKTSRNQH